MIPFNKIHLTGKETEYISEVLASKQISGNGIFTKKTHCFLENKYQIKKTFLTSSCTDALEMASILIDLKPEDEVIIPSFTFVSTANAFLLRGAKVVFADSLSDNPNIDVAQIEGLITKKTKAIVVVHYAGVACDMDAIMILANKYNLFVIEDSAHAIDAFYNNKPLGTIGHLGAFSFHESKNITSGEGGFLAVNDVNLIKRAELIWEKGTDRSAFLKGEINKYGWKDVGSSFYPSDITAAFLFAQLQEMDNIQNIRKAIWESYYKELQPYENRNYFQLPKNPIFSTNNGHIFYIVCNSNQERNHLIEYLKNNEITAAFHFISLHKSTFFAHKHDGRILINSDKFSDCLVRFPLFYDLSSQDVIDISKVIISYFENRFIAT